MSLHAAAERGDLGTARRELFAQGSRHGGLLHRAIVTWNIDLVRFLVNKRAYDYEDEPLNIAIIWGKSNMFEVMVNDSTSTKLTHGKSCFSLWLESSQLMSTLLDYYLNAFAFRK